MNSQQLVKALQQQSIVINNTVITVDQLRTAFNIEVRKSDEHTSLLYLNKTVNIGEVHLIGGMQEKDLTKMIPKLQRISNRLRTCIDICDILGIYDVINDSKYVDFLIHDDVKSFCLSWTYLLIFQVFLLLVSEHLLL